MSVTILQEGVPVAGAFVRLIPENSEMPWSCGGTTNESGVAIVRTIGEFDGAPEGSYKVAVSKLEMPPMQAGDLSNLDAPPAKSDDSFELIDPQYANPNKTPLKITVSKDSYQEKFEVGPAVRVKRRGPL